MNILERWKEIGNGYNYKVSDRGRVKRIGTSKDHSVRNRHGYLITDLYKNGTRISKGVHRLVAEAFVPNPYNKPEVNHKDGNKHNNEANNLEWVTKKENCEHAWNTGLARASYGMKGKKNPNGGRKGIPFKIVETGEIFNTAIECAQKIGGNHRHINDCLLGRQKTHRGYHFEYI